MLKKVETAICRAAQPIALMRSPAHAGAFLDELPGPKAVVVSVCVYPFVYPFAKISGIYSLG